MPSARKLGVLVGASVGLVALAVVLLANREGERAPTVASAVQMPVGIRGADIDGARRTEETPEAAPVAPATPPGPVPAAVADAPPREDRGAAPQVSPPVVPNAEALAESEAIAAVLPAAREQVESSLAAQRTALRDACWKPGAASSVNLPLEATFAADGALLALSIADDRAAPGVGACVRARPLPLAIAAPGVPLTVTTTLTLP